jgi:hypothetical protein
MRQGWFGAFFMLLGAGFACAQSGAAGTPLPPPTPPPEAIIGTDSPGPVLDAPPPGGEPYRPTQEASAFPCDGWVHSDYLLWDLKNGPKPPPLATTGPFHAQSPGVLGGRGTIVLFPEHDFEYGNFSGGRWEIGCWLNAHETLGVAVSGLLLEQRAVGFAALSDGGGSPILGLPFKDVTSGRELVDFVSFPRRFAGGISVLSRDRVWGMEGTLLGNGYQTALFFGDRPAPVGDFRADWLAGFRYLDFDENLEIAQGSVVLGGGTTDFNGTPIGPKHALIISDGFSARNQFYGAQLGFRGELTRGCFFVDFLGKVGLGATREILEVSGDTTLTRSREPQPGRPLLVAFGTPATTPGGFLATTTNIGKFQHERFAVLPELGINFGYQLHPLFRVFAGYTFLYWSDVVRPGDQIDRVINLTRVPTSGTFSTTLQGPARPALPFHTTDFWAQGVNFGFEVRF